MAPPDGNGKRAHPKGHGNGNGGPAGQSIPAPVQLGPVVVQHPPAVPEPPATPVPAVCGDFGGKTRTGAPCQHKVTGGRCAAHRKEAPAPGGGTTIEFTQEQVGHVERLASVLTMAQMADFFGISEGTLHNIRKRDSRVDVAYKRGRAQAIATVGGTLLRKALSGHTTSVIFFLKTQAGWRETTHLEVENVTEREDVPLENLSDTELFARARVLSDRIFASPGQPRPVVGGNGKPGPAHN